MSGGGTRYARARGGMASMIVEVVEGDVRTTRVDVLVLKFAQRARGADLAVSLALGRDLTTPTGQHRFIKSDDKIHAREVLVLGVGPLSDFDYKEIASFARHSLEIVRSERPGARSVGITVHGPGYGLDELASMGSLANGLLAALNSDPSVDGIGSGDFRILIIESSSRRAQRIREFLDGGAKSNRPLTLDGGEPFTPEAAKAISSDGTYQKRLFAAMPFHRDYLDLWELAIQPAAHENGMPIERLDHEHFTGEIVSEIRTRIERSAAVVAILDENNPNVFLEVGYAWGVKKPAVLVLKEGQEAPFDVRSQRLIRYTRLGQLKSSLANELRGLLASSVI